MATEPIRNLSDAELARKKEEEGILAGKILEKQHEAARDFGEFKVRVPSAIEGGGQPARVSEVTAKTMGEVKEGDVDASVLTVPTTEMSSAGVGAEALKHLQEGDLFEDGKGGTAAQKLTDFLQALGDHKE